METNQTPLKISVAKNWLAGIKRDTLVHMIARAEKQLNPEHYELSPEAKKRLKWLYVLYCEENGNITVASKKIGLSRPWLSHLKAVFEDGGRDPRKLEPCSKAPHHTENRNRISKETEKKILEVRSDSQNVWGKKKIARVLKRDYGIACNPNTVNQYLHKHGKINPKISLKNMKAWQAKKARENMEVSLKVKYRPPKGIKDYAPGALVEKDMKYVPKYAQTTPGKSGENFYNQHTEIDSFTRIRSVELMRDGTAESSAEAHKRAVAKFPFKIACENTDNGSENQSALSQQLHDENIFHFYSGIGTPTDNPRVERSHLTDEVEFYQSGGLKRSFEEQRTAVRDFEHLYNWKRPHQALGYLTPMEFYELWKSKPDDAYEIVKKYQSYLLKQRIRLAQARKIKKKDQIEKLMKFIDAKLNDNKTQIQRTKLSLIECQLCSMA